MRIDQRNHNKVHCEYAIMLIHAYTRCPINHDVIGAKSNLRQRKMLFFLTTISIFNISLDKVK